MATAKLYQPDSASPFALSRSKVKLFLDCPRCFYLDQRLGIARPPGFPFNLNSAVDALLKREFDRYRSEEKAHPLMTEGGIRAVPHAHPQLENRRNNFLGVRTTHAGTNLEFFGAIDDLWRDLDTGNLMLVDYKATSKATEVTMDAHWQDSDDKTTDVYLRDREVPIADGPVMTQVLGAK